MRRLGNVIIVILVLTFVGGVLLTLIVRVQHSAARMQCSNNLRQLGIALHNYRDAHEGHFPPAVVPHPFLPVDERLSFLAALEPYIEKTGWRRDAAGRWNAPENREMATMPMKVFRCAHRTEDTKDDYWLTSYVGVAGVGHDSPNLPRTHARAGIFGYESSATKDDLKRGESNILLLVETGASLGPRVRGGYSTVRGIDPDGDFDGQHPGRPTFWMRYPLHDYALMAAMADGSVRYFKAEDVLSKLATLREDAPPP